MSWSIKFLLTHVMLIGISPFPWFWLVHHLFPWFLWITSTKSLVYKSSISVMLFEHRFQEVDWQIMFSWLWLVPNQFHQMLTITSLICVKYISSFFCVDWPYVCLYHYDFDHGNSLLCLIDIIIYLWICHVDYLHILHFLWCWNKFIKS